MFHRLKKQLPKFYTHISTALVVIILFILQFVVLEGNLEFYKDYDFWFSLFVMLAILIVVNEIYWRNGTVRGEVNDKYIGSSIEYSIRVNHLKNNNPSLTEDFYKYIDELNVQLYIEARNDLLDTHHILRDDYYGSFVETVDDAGNRIVKRTVPHCELSKAELKSLTRTTIQGDVMPYYTRKQISVILRAIYGNFQYERVNATEILSGTRFKNNKYATSYNAKKNKLTFALNNAVMSIAISVLGAMLGASLIQEGWSVVALFVFLYRILMVVWRAIASDEGGYNDIAEVKRSVNINRSNVITMYTRNRNLDSIFENIDTEIMEAKKLSDAQLGKEATLNGNG